MKKIIAFDNTLPIAALNQIKAGVKSLDLKFLEVIDTIKPTEINKVIAFISKRPIKSSLMKKMHNLQLYQIAKAGYEEFDLKTFPPFCAVCNNGGANSNSVSEHTLLLILAVLRNAWFHHQTVLDGKWINLKNNNEELAGKTALVVGFGNVGQKVAKKLYDLGVEVFINDIDPNMMELGHFRGFKPFKLYSSGNCFDIITFHIPCFKKDENFINEKLIKYHFDKTILINTARGKLMDLEQIIVGIEKGKIKGLGLDVFPDEPFVKINDFLKSIENIAETGFLGCFFAPHAGPSAETNRELATIITHNINEIFKNKKFRGRIV